MAYEDFSTYVEIDPLSKITINPLWVRWVNCNLNQTEYVYKDFGADYFSGDFTHQFELQFSSQASASMAIHYMLGTAIGDAFALSYAAGEYAFWIADSRPGGTRRILAQIFENGSPGGYGIWTGPAENTWYYLTVEFDADGGVGGVGRFTVTIRIDSHEGAIQDTFVIDRTAAVGYRYIYSHASWDNNGGTYSTTGYTQNLNLSAGIITHEYDGEISIELAPEADYYEPAVAEYDGEIPIACNLESSYETGVGWYYYSNEIPLELFPEAGTGSFFGWNYDGVIFLNLVPEAAISKTTVRDGEISIQFVPQGDYVKIGTMVFRVSNRFLQALIFIIRNALARALKFRISNVLAQSQHIIFRITNRLSQADALIFTIRNELLQGGWQAMTHRISNCLLPGTIARLISHTYDITVNGSSIKDYVIDASITISHYNFSNEADLSIDSLTALNLLISHKGSGQDVLVITIDGTDYKFMVETIDVDRAWLGIQGPRIRVWGRSKTAKLEDPNYATLLTQVWDSPALLSDIVAELAPGFSITNDLEDYVVPANELQAENVPPMSLLTRLAEAQGGIVRSGLAGELHLRREYPVSPASIESASAEATLYHTDDLLLIGDQKIAAAGFNAVLIEGHSEAGDELSIQAELDSERNDGRSVFPPGSNAYVRIFLVPFTLAYDYQLTLGSAFFLGRYANTIVDELIQVSDGVARTRYPVLSIQDLDWDGREFSSPQWEVGGNEIRWTVAEGCSGSAFLRLDYTTQYDLWRVTAPEGMAILCLEDE